MITPSKNTMILSAGLLLSAFTDNKHKTRLSNELKTQPDYKYKISHKTDGKPDSLQKHDDYTTITYTKRFSFEYDETLTLKAIDGLNGVRNDTIEANELVSAKYVIKNAVCLLRYIKINKHKDKGSLVQTFDENTAGPEKSTNSANTNHLAQNLAVYPEVKKILHYLGDKP